MTYLIIFLALAAFICIVFEEALRINKAKSTLFIGTLSWIFAYVFSINGKDSEFITEKLNENLLEIASLWLFLMSAMTFVAYLNSKNFISNITQHVMPSHISERSLMIFMGIFAFIFSSLADNVTATLVSLSIVNSLQVSQDAKLKYAALTVFAVNSGGAALITGDVTTLMLFMNGKVSITALFLLIGPALLAVLILGLLFSLSLSHNIIHFNVSQTTLSQRDKTIAIIFVSTILATLTLNIIYHIPPVLTFLFGLSCMFLFAKLREDEADENILNYIRQIEFDTLLFFLGILLIVGILKEVGLLRHLTELYHIMPAPYANFLMGVFSALIDNVPLTAAVLKSDIDMSPAEWLSITYAVGVGGSLLIIGSAAGIIAMSKVKEVNFISYFSLFLYLFFAYAIGYWACYFVGLKFL